MRTAVLIAALAVMAGCGPTPPGRVSAETHPHLYTSPATAADIAAENEWQKKRATADAEAAAYCRFAGVAAGAGNPVFGGSLWGEARAQAACLDYYRVTGRVPGR